MKKFFLITMLLSVVLMGSAQTVNMKMGNPTPENAGSAKVMGAGSGRTFTATCRVNINRLFFGADEYPFLKEFFDLLASKCSEMIVISKE